MRSRRCGVVTLSGALLLCGCGADPGQPAHEQVSVGALPALPAQLGDSAFRQRLDAALQQDPFMRPAQTSETRSAAMMEFSVRELIPRGVLSDRRGHFALVETAAGRVVRVALGDSIGAERARVVAFDATGLTLELPGEAADQSERIVRLTGVE